MKTPSLSKCSCTILCMTMEINHLKKILTIHFLSKRIAISFKTKFTGTNLHVTILGVLGGAKLL